VAIRLSPFLHASDTTFRRLCQQRHHWPAGADIWHLRFHWQRERLRIRDALHAGEYLLVPLSVVHRATGDNVVIWSAADALVMHCLTAWSASRLLLHRPCEHLRGHGGGHVSVRRIDALMCNGRIILCVAPPVADITPASVKPVCGSRCGNGFTVPSYRTCCGSFSTTALRTVDGFTRPKRHRPQPRAQPIAGGVSPVSP